jgi:hypothetical protein
MEEKKRAPKATHILLARASLNTLSVVAQAEEDDEGDLEGGGVSLCL